MTYLAESWKRWLVWLVLVVVFAASCVFLSEWQFERRAARVVEIELVQQNFDKPAVAIATVDLVAKQSKWTPVRVVGEYLNESQVLVRNRPRSGQPGFETVVAFRTVDGQTFAVSRGWLPTGNLQDSPDVLPLPSEKTQEIVARLVPGERQLDRGAPDGQVASMNLAEIAAETGLQINQQWYLRLASEQEPAEQAVKLLKPTTDEGNHLSYAIQWLIFGALAFVTLVFTVRKEYDFYRSKNDPTYVPKVRKKTRAESDQELEDSVA
jgi:cytochrome oxidase assembly protein ShyY1